MKYFLVGYMGAGKSYYGRELARNNNTTFIDLDEYITMMEQKSINDIFALKGEDGFRELETRYLKEICSLFGDFVLSTGGGTPCFNSNMEYMNSQGHTIFVNTNPEIIVQRLMNNKRRRPILKDLKDSEIKAFVEKHLEERMPFYKMAKEMTVSE